MKNNDVMMHNNDTVKKLNFRPFFHQFMVGLENFKELISPSDVAHLIDHTVLSPTASEGDIARLVREAREYRFASVCVNPTHVAYAVEQGGSDVLVATVVGFPLGATTPEAKAYEARQALESGATEIDMVVNHAYVHAHDVDALRRDIVTVAEAVRGYNGTLKCIIEAGYHTPEQVAFATEAVLWASGEVPDVHFMAKTSTGFATSKLLVAKYDETTAVGARVEDLNIMAQVLEGSSVGMKASGGVGTFDDACSVLYAMGARTKEDLSSVKYRIGASAGVQIVSGK